MKLSEIKKCKVPELRAKLKELGLDPKGLKTELIGRLWSAVEAGLQERLKSSEDYETTANPNPNPSSSATETDTVDVKTTSPAMAIMSSYISHSIREYADTATQTDRCSSLTPGLEGSVVREEEEEEERRATTPTSMTSMLQEYTALQRSPHLEDSEFSCAGSGHVLADGDEMEGSRSWHEEEETSGTSSRLEQMGRAFYEFKEEIRYKRAKLTQPAHQLERDLGVDRESVRIDTYSSDLHFQVDLDCSAGRPRFGERFPLLWSGCQLTHGPRPGTGSSFEVRLEEDASGGRPGAERGRDSPDVRVGWARDDNSATLGEGELSYAYDGRGRKISGGKEEEYGESLSKGDIIGCYLLFSADGAAEMSFHKNGRPMGLAFRRGPSVLGGHTLFPHVLCRGCSVHFRLGPAGAPWYPGPPGCTPLVGLPAAQRVRAPEGPSSRLECEVVMMVGLPGSGKSHWAKTLVKQHPEKHYHLLSTETLLTCMIGEGPSDRKLQQASQCLTELIKMAACKPRNYILDQPNVLVSARRHKLQLFAGHGRRVVAVVFPPADEWRRRLALRQGQDGERIPDTALLKLKVSCSLPQQPSELFQELRFVELPQEEAHVLLQAYREEARRLLPPVPKPQKKKARVRKSRALQPPHGHRWKRRYGDNETVFARQAWGSQPIYWNQNSNPTQHWLYDSTGYGYSGYHGNGASPGDPYEPRTRKH